MLATEKFIEALSAELNRAYDIEDLTMLYADIRLNLDNEMKAVAESIKTAIEETAVDNAAT